MNCCLLSQEVRKILENIENLQAQDFMEKQLYEELFSVKSKIDRSEIKFKLMDRAKSVKAKHIAEEFIKEFQKAEQEKEKEEKANRSMQLVENITNFYPDSVDKEYPNMACGSWIATENGIFSSETSKARELVCHHPIMPIRRLKNIETGEEQITVAFKRDGYWTEITVPKIDIVTSRAITNLARFGVQVNSENARLLVKYLADVEMYNADMIDIQHSTSKLGWHGNVFVPYDLSIVFDGEYRFKTLFQSIQESGDYFKWVTLAKQLRSCGRLEPRIALAASFASVLVALSGIAKLAKSVGRSLVEVWTNGTGTTMLTTMLRIAQNVLKTIGNIASGFADAWNKNNVGTQIIQNIADALVVVMQFVEKIAEDTATWAANLDFYPLLESISNLTSAFAPILESIGNVLEWIYKNIVLPMLKWVIEVGLPTVVNLVAKVATFLADHQPIVEAFGAALIGAFAAAKIAGLASSVIKSVSGIAMAAKGLISLMTGTGGIMGGIKAIATAIGPAGIFVIAVSAAIAIGVLLYKNWDKIKEAATKLKDWVVGKTRALVDGVTKKLTNLKEKISGVWKYVREKTTTTFGNMWNTVTTKVGAIKDAIVSKFTSARDTVVDTFARIRDTVASVFNNVIGIVNGAIGTINNAIGTIESALSFGPWKVPTPFGSKTIGFKATFPRVPTVPYLAKGAVIPPRSEFLAVLGDQKQGNNIETPEALLRKIVREETAGRQTGGGSYRFTAQINRRTLFDEMMKEAQMRRDTSGRNPFEMA